MQCFPTREVSAARQIHSATVRQVARNPQNCSLLKNHNGKTGRNFFVQIAPCSRIPLYFELCKFQKSLIDSFGVSHLDSVNFKNSITNVLKALGRVQLSI